MMMAKLKVYYFSPTGGTLQVARHLAEKMTLLASDSNPRVRLAFIWASENIATNTPDAYEHSMSMFAELLHDSDDRSKIRTGL